MNISELEKAIKATLSAGQQPALAGLAGNGMSIALSEEFRLAAGTLASRSGRQSKSNGLLSVVASTWS